MPQTNDLRWFQPGEGCDVLECQSCGTPVRVLTPAEVQEVARNPYRFTVWCTPCQEGVLRSMQQAVSMPDDFKDVILKKEN